MSSEQNFAVVHYGGERFTVPTEAAEDIHDIITGLDLLGGSHVYRIGGGGDDDILRLWIAPGVPIALQFPNGYESPDDRDDYVINHLKMEARYRLNLPIDGSGDGEPSIDD